MLLDRNVGTDGGLAGARIADPLTLHVQKFHIGQ